MAKRSTEEVFADHLQLRKQGDVEADIQRNFAEDVVIVSEFGTFHGRDGIRQSNDLLHQQLPSKNYTYEQCLTDQDIAFERWDGSSQDMQVKNGIDFFLIQDGYIQLQLIYYKPQPRT
jgi:hypothetical protein